MHLEDVEQSSQDDISFAKRKYCPLIASKVDVPPENEQMSPEKRPFEKERLVFQSSFLPGKHP